VSDGLAYDICREVDKIQLKEKDSLTSISSGPHSNDALSNYDRIKALVKKERLGHQKNVELVSQQMKLEPEGETRQYSHTVSTASWS
jgi:Ni,Fe-hydrogenase I large subunit